MGRRRPGPSQRSRLAMEQDAAARLSALDAARVVRLERKAARQRDRARRDVQRFLRYCRIEDPDAAEKLIPFRLWPMQRDALATFCRSRLTVVLKARQLGLTWLALAYALWRMLFTPGYTVVVLSRGEDETKELARRAGVMLDHLPRWLARSSDQAPRGWQGPVYEVHAYDIIIEHPDGPPSRFLAETAARDSGRSFTASLVLIDEWGFQQWADDIWRAAFPIINRPTGGQVIGISSGQPATLFEAIWRDAVAGRNGFTPVFLPWHADPRRTVAWYEDTKRAMPATYRAEYPETPEEAFSGALQVAFPMFDARDGSPYVCRPFAVPAWWQRWIGHDPGYGDPFAWYWFAVAPDGRIVCYREFARRADQPRLNYSEQAERVVAMSVEGTEHLPQGAAPPAKPVPERLAYVACGWDAYRVEPQSGRCIADYYADAGLSGCVEAPRNRQARYAAVLEAFRTQDWGDPEQNPVSTLLGRYTARLVIFDTCRLLIETLPRLVRDERHPDQVAESSIDHYYDALGYGLQTWHPETSQEPPPQKSIVMLDKERRIRMRERRFMRVI